MKPSVKKIYVPIYHTDSICTNTRKETACGAAGFTVYCLKDPNHFARANHIKRAKQEETYDSCSDF